VLLNFTTLKGVFMSTQIEKVIRGVTETAEEIRNDAEQRFPEAATPGDSWRQGDLYITLLGEVPSGVERSESPSNQLVPGTTQGSRHCLDSLEGVVVYTLPQLTQLDGPIIECREEKKITHPEHGNVVLPPGVYGIHYQRNLDAEERERRVLD
jgi:hypothetical protein